MKARTMMSVDPTPTAAEVGALREPPEALIDSVTLSYCNANYEFGLPRREHPMFDAHRERIAWALRHNWPNILALLLPAQPAEDTREIAERVMHAAYAAGVEDGLEAYAINRDGKQYVGNSTELRTAQREKRALWNWGYSLGQVWADLDEALATPPEPSAEAQGRVCTRCGIACCGRQRPSDKCWDVYACSHTTETHDECGGAWQIAPVVLSAPLAQPAPAGEGLVEMEAAYAAADGDPNLLSATVEFQGVARDALDALTRAEARADRYAEALREIAGGLCQNAAVEYEPPCGDCHPCVASRALSGPEGEE
jgi:hypothetical protein